MTPCCFTESTVKRESHWLSEGNELMNEGFTWATICDLSEAHWCRNADTLFISKETPVGPETER